jgi:hypothetical protein
MFISSECRLLLRFRGRSRCVVAPELEPAPLLKWSARGMPQRASQPGNVGELEVWLDQLGRAAQFVAVAQGHRRLSELMGLRAERRTVSPGVTVSAQNCKLAA